MKNTHTYLKSVPVLEELFGTIVFLFSIWIALSSSTLFGFFMAAFAVYLLSIEGSQINFETKIYRTIWSIFSIHFGRWKSIPKFDYISVFNGRQKQRVNGLGASTVFTDEVYFINIFYHRNKHITFYKTFNKEEAFVIATEFQIKLELEILDATEKERV